MRNFMRVFERFVNFWKAFYAFSKLIKKLKKLIVTKSSINLPFSSWGARPLSDDLLLNAADECHCIVTALYRLLSVQIPDQCRQLFEDKCTEACQPQRPTSNGQLSASNSSHQLSASSSFDYPSNLYRPPARRQSSTTSVGSQHAGDSRPNGRLVKQHSSGAPTAHTTRPRMCDSSTQTFSTGEITVLQVYYDNWVFW